MQPQKLFRRLEQKPPEIQPQTPRNEASNLQITAAVQERFDLEGRQVPIQEIETPNFTLWFVNASTQVQVNTEALINFLNDIGVKEMFTLIVTDDPLYVGQETNT